MSDTPLLPHNETLALLQRVRQGDAEAEERLVLSNTALVKSIVKKYLGRSVEYDDLMQVGTIGLIKAIKNYDESYHVRFSTYAVPMIAGEIKRFLRDDGIVKVSRSIKELAFKVAKTQEKLGISLGREPTIREIADQLDVEPEDIVAAMEVSKPCRSIDEPMFDDNEETALVERIPSPKTEETMVLNRVLLKEMFNDLSPRERQILILRYFRDKTQGEIAQLLGISQVQVSRLENKILKNLREKSREDPL